MSDQKNMQSQEVISQLNQQLQQRIIGQQELVESLLIALLADGHLLVEGAPGLAKTTAIKTLSDHLHGDFKRIQFTPDLMPADVTGSDIYRVEEHRFEFQPGPVFANLVLADEINRAPAKVQSALLEAMSERQVTASGKTYALPAPFLVMATQNPIEQEGTYPLPEAQLDRFLMKVTLDYPSIDDEAKILALARNEQTEVRTPPATEQTLSLETVISARQELNGIHVSDAVDTYMLHLINASRQPDEYDSELSRLIQFGASPRATIAMDRCARALAWLEGKDFVTPEQVQRVASRVLGHRLILTLEAQARGLDGHAVVQTLLESVPIS